jgi:pimeloyl-ACP methyl ester carboxylesterase
MLVPRHATRHPYARGLVRAGDGYVHYRRAGNGPVVVALHESPRSSLSLLPLMDALADRHTVIALDTPGYGQSDPLPLATPRMADFTRALAAAVDGLGLGRFALYGTHTGAAIATAFALEAPGRITSLVLDGLAAFTPAEREAFLQHYLPPFEPRWDGAHLAQLWSRVGDSYRWFPWFARTPGTRVASPLPPLDKFHETLEGFLLAGDAYRLGYACAASFDGRAALAQLRVPTLLCAQDNDVIASHVGRGVASDHVRITRPVESREEWAGGIRAQFMIDAAQTLPWRPADAPRERDPQRVLLEWGNGFLHARGRGEGQSPALVIPDLPDTAAGALADIAAADDNAGDVRHWAIDLPGSGASDPVPHDTDLVAAAAAAVDFMRDALQVGQGAVIGCGAGAALAAPFAGARVCGLSRAQWSVPAAQRDAHGAAFLGSWFQLRDAQVDADPAGGVPDARRLQQRHTALWTGPQCALLAQALRQRLAEDTALRARLRALEGEAN